MEPYYSDYPFLGPFKGALARPKPQTPKGPSPLQLKALANLRGLSTSRLAMDQDHLVPSF